MCYLGDDMEFNWNDAEQAYFETASQEERRIAMANAFLARDWNAFEWILKKGINPNEVPYDMLWDSVRKQDVDAVRKLLAYGCNVHVIDDVAFRDAVRLGNMEIASILKEAGADVHAVNDEAMSLAAEQGDATMIRQLRAWGVPASGWKNDPLVRAAEGGSVESVKELIRLGATLEDEEGYFLPVRAAIRQNNEEMGKLIVRNMKKTDEVIAAIEESDAFLPDDWKQKIERWRLAVSLEG